MDREEDSQNVKNILVDLIASFSVFARSNIPVAVEKDLLQTLT